LTWLASFVTLKMDRVKNYITIDKDIVSGTPVFKGTRVPVQTLFDHLEDGITIDEFLIDFPSVSKKQARAVIAIAARIVTSKNLSRLYETIAR
jgi:uncharacterized protein (DUF433 family)